jgi:hypothetical protein
MTVTAAADTYAALLEAGEPVLLRRIATPPVAVQCAARVDDFAPHEIAGAVQQGDRRVIICNAEIAAAGWPGPPRRGDQLIIDGRTTTIQGCATLRIGSEVVRHTLQVRGG